MNLRCEFLNWWVSLHGCLLIAHQNMSFLHFLLTSRAVIIIRLSFYLDLHLLLFAHRNLLLNVAMDFLSYLLLVGRCYGFQNFLGLLFFLLWVSVLFHHSTLSIAVHDYLSSFFRRETSQLLNTFFFDHSCGLLGLDFVELLRLVNIGKFLFILVDGLGFGELNALIHIHRFCGLMGNSHVLSDLMLLLLLVAWSHLSLWLVESIGELMSNRFLELVSVIHLHLGVFGVVVMVVVMVMMMNVHLIRKFLISFFFFFS